MRLTFLRTGAALVALGVVLAGCGTAAAPAAPGPASAAPTVDPAAPRTVPPGMGSPASDGVFPRTVTHFGGTTEIPAAPQRVVVIGTGQLDAALSLGVVPVGAARGDGAGVVPDYLRGAFPALATQLGGMADLGLRTSPNLESIAAAHPDLILANKAGAGDAYPQLSRIAPTVLTEGTGVKWKQDMLLVAHALGRAQQAQALLDAFHADAAALGARLGKPETVSFLRITADRVRIFGIGSFTGSVAADAGLARPPDQQFPQTSQDISPERLAAADADHLFYGVQGGPAAAADMLGSDVWRRIGAVSGGRAVSVDDDVWYLNAGPVAARQVLTGLAAALTG